MARTKDSSASLYIVKPDSNTELQSLLNGVVRLATTGGLAN